MGSKLEARADAPLASADDLVGSYDANLKQLYGYFRAKGVPTDDAKDLSNEAIVRTLVHLKRHGQRAADLGPLMRTIARNLAVERIRKAPPRTVPLADAPDVADESPTIEDRLVESERRRALREAMSSLSPRHRRVLELSMQGSSPNDIARTLGVKRNAVDAILHRARRNLMSRLDGSALGIGAVLALRVRSFARRVSETLSFADPSGQLAAAASGVAAIAVVAAGSLSAAYIGTADAHPIESSEPAAAAMEEAAESTEGSKAHTDEAEAVSGGSAVSVGSPNVRVGADLAERRGEAAVTRTRSSTGEEETYGIGVWYHRDDLKRGRSGPMIERTTEAACGALLIDC